MSVKVLRKQGCKRYAKTLYMPERPKHIKERITKYTGVNVPHFFKYAKGKEDHQISKLNDSFVNKLEKKIPNPRISYKYTENYKNKKLGKPNYTLMMSNPDIEVEIVTSKSGKLINGTNPVVLKYAEKAKEYWQKINATAVQDCNRDVLTKSQIKKELLYFKIIEEVKSDLSNLGYVDSEIADILVKYLYGIKESKYKDLLWICYGDYLYDNLKKNVKQTTKIIQCVDCGKWFEVDNDKKHLKTCRCFICDKEYKDMLNRNRVNKYRNKSKE